MRPSDVSTLSLQEALVALVEGGLSATTMAEALLERIAQLNPQVGALTEVLESSAPVCAMSEISRSCSRVNSFLPVSNRPADRKLYRGCSFRAESLSNPSRVAAKRMNHSS